MNQDFLKSIMSYNLETGVFLWLTHRQKSRIGTEVGTISEGYKIVKIQGKFYRLSRLAILYVTGHMPSSLVDHHNKNTLDNSFDNLRVCTNTENGANRKVNVNSTSGYKGVCFSHNKWKAYIGVNGKMQHIGYFLNKEEAAIAYNIKAKELFGEYASLNVL